MYTIAGKFTVKPEYKDQLIEMSKKLIPQSLQESGCISYGFYEDQTTLGDFLFFEEWQSRETITQHFGTSYFQDFAKKFPEMIVGKASIKIYQVSNIESV